MSSGVRKTVHQDFHDDDELPAFLMKLTREELVALKDSIESRRVRSLSQAMCKLYTIHSFKGLEDEVVRVAGDVNPKTEPNLHYVALTRGTAHVYADVTEVKEDKTEVKDAVAKPKSTKTPPLTKLVAKLPAEEGRIAEALVMLRKDRAKVTDKPAYTVFSNRVLLAIAHTRPVDTEALRAIHGVGDKLIQGVGQAVLSACKA